MEIGEQNVLTFEEAAQYLSLNENELAGLVRSGALDGLAIEDEILFNTRELDKLRSLYTGLSIQ
ncbi:MAG: hypothetical protein IH874_03940 [Candidatus Dadabacteria bacterium]|nr:hypothetical protein [Candidatus Dadabacteria bacterium]